MFTVCACALHRVLVCRLYVCRVLYTDTVCVCVHYVSVFILLNMVAGYTVSSLLMNPDSSAPCSILTKVPYLYNWNTNTATSCVSHKIKCLYAMLPVKHTILSTKVTNLSKEFINFFENRTLEEKVVSGPWELFDKTYQTWRKFEEYFNCVKISLQ